MKKSNILLSIGLLFYAIIQLLKHLVKIDVPDFVEGFITGIALVFMVLGIISISYKLLKLKNFKRNLFNKKIS